MGNLSTTQTTPPQVDGGPRLIDGNIINALINPTNSNLPTQNLSAHYFNVDYMFMDGLFYESTNEGLTAHAGGGQANATMCGSEINRVTTVATAGDSVQLPQALPGLTIIIINHGNNPMQVYGSYQYGDTVDDSPTGTGVSQMVGSVCIYTCTLTGKWYANGLGSGFSGSLQTLSYTDALSANSGGVQTGATSITTSFARFTTVGGAGYSSVLPASVAGLEITVINAGANNMNVFPAGTDAINGGPASAAYVLPVNCVVTFICTVAGKWHTILSVNVPQPLYYQTNTSTAGTTLSAANISGYAANPVEIDLAMTGTLGAGANAQLPTVASLVANIPNAIAGQTYKLRVINESSANFAWTITTNTGWTLNGTMSIAQNTWRDFIVTLSSLTAATLQNVGTGTYS